MEIKLKNRGSLYVYDGNKSIWITGELSAGPEYIFYADLVALDYWMIDNTNKRKILDEKKKIIMDKIIAEGEKIKLKIVFD